MRRISFAFCVPLLLALTEKTYASHDDDDLLIHLLNSRPSGQPNTPTGTSSPPSSSSSSVGTAPASAPSPGQANTPSVLPPSLSSENERTVPESVAPSASSPSLSSENKGTTPGSTSTGQPNTPSALPPSSSFENQGTAPASAPTGQQANTPTSSSSKENCEISNGSYGSESGTRVLVRYFYRMHYKNVTALNDAILDLEDAITTMIFSGMFPRCSETRRTRRNEEKSIVGISSAPDDKLISNCGDTCAIVEGRLSLYLASSKRRRLSAVEDQHANDILKSTENAMNNGDLLSANDNIVSLEYLPPTDSAIIYDDEAEAAQNMGDRENKGVPVAGRGLPTYMFAFFGLALSIIVVSAAFVTKRRMKQRSAVDDEFDEEVGRTRARTPTQANNNPNDSASMSYMPRYEEPRVSQLYDDGSVSFLDMSGAVANKTINSWNATMRPLEDSSLS
jgi:hypothetical protein